MSATRPSAGGGPRGGPMAGMFSAPPAKTKDFKGSLKRLLKELGPERKVLSLVLSLITVSVVV